MKQIEIVALEMSNITIAEISAKTGASYNEVLSVLNALTAKGKLVKPKKGLWKNPYTPTMTPAMAIKAILGDTPQPTPPKLQFVITDKSQSVDPLPVVDSLPVAEWRTLWELDNLDLRKECAEFYVAADICSTAPGQSARDIYLKPVAERLAKQFASYLDMALGGELRHCRAHMNNFSSHLVSSPVHAAILSKARAGGSRHSMWVEWHALRRQYGIDALKVARDVFLKGSWSSAFGGKKWGLAAEVLIRYLEGEDSMVTFVDTVWSLQHNTNFILNKVWQIPNDMKKMLDNKFAGNIAPLVSLASMELQFAWNIEENCRRMDRLEAERHEIEEREQEEQKKVLVSNLAGMLKTSLIAKAQIQAQQAIEMLAVAQEVLNGN